MTVVFSNDKVQVAVEIEPLLTVFNWSRKRIEFHLDGALIQLWPNDHHSTRKATFFDIGEVGWVFSRTQNLWFEVSDAYEVQY